MDRYLRQPAWTDKELDDWMWLDEQSDRGYRQTGRKRDRQTDREAGRKTGRHKYILTDSLTDQHTLLTGTIMETQAESCSVMVKGEWYTPTQLCGDLRRKVQTNHGITLTQITEWTSIRVWYFLYEPKTILEKEKCIRLAYNSLLFIGKGCFIVCVRNCLKQLSLQKKQKTALWCQVKSKHALNDAVLKISLCDNIYDIYKCVTPKIWSLVFNVFNCTECKESLFSNHAPSLFKKNL